ncbi:unnamed protein product [Pleuronectes platessa]|uniref:Uncharacterized protein n=1 Tax=Pleuronectes platessa TaxID=8262 RepID=A0A9N7UQV3_PLEPL|nr:unnamed protein product [Pleuronectes platessa]
MEPEQEDQILIHIQVSLGSEQRISPGHQSSRKSNLQEKLLVSFCCFSSMCYVSSSVEDTGESLRSFYKQTEDPDRLLELAAATMTSPVLRITLDNLPEKRRGSSVDCSQSCIFKLHSSAALEVQCLITST